MYVRFIVWQQAVLTISVHFLKSQSSSPPEKTRSWWSLQSRLHAEVGVTLPGARLGPLDLFSSAVVTPKVQCGLLDSASRFELIPWGTRSRNRYLGGSGRSGKISEVWERERPHGRGCSAGKGQGALPGLFPWKAKRRNTNSRAGFMKLCLSLPLHLAHHHSATSSENSRRRKMINPLLFCTGSQTRREVPLLLSTRNFVDQPKFRQADIFYHQLN